MQGDPQENLIDVCFACPMQLVGFSKRHSLAGCIWWSKSSGGLGVPSNMFLEPVKRSAVLPTLHNKYFVKWSMLNAFAIELGILAIRIHII